MPLPLAHAFVGAAIAEMFLPAQAAHRRLKVAIIGCLAVVPDFDFIPVWFCGFSRDWHRGFSHSIAFAIAMGTPALLQRGSTWLRDMTVCALAVASHGLLDAGTTSEGRGVELFWPFSPHRVKLGLVDIWEFSPDWIWPGEFARALVASALELMLFGPLLLGAIWLHRRVASSTGRL